MTDDGTNIVGKTWSRAIEPVNKLGYTDGAVDGQAAVFQSSFDIGYEQGFSFGLQLGLNKSASIQENSKYLESRMTDRKLINCQLCLNGTTQQSVTNLYNIQQENNATLLKTM